MRLYDEVVPQLKITDCKTGIFSCLINEQSFNHERKLAY